jgi:hypothetical protein
MTTLRRWLFFSLLTLPVSATAQNGDPEPRPRYRIDATVHADRIEGVAEISVPAALRPDGAIRIDPLSAGMADGRPRLHVIEARDELGHAVHHRTAADGTLLYDVSTSAGGESHLHIRFRVPLDMKGLADLGYFLFSAHRRGTRWYPEVVGPGDRTLRFADYEVDLTWPDSLTVLGSGDVTGEIRDGGQRRGRLAADHVEGFTLALGPRHELVRLERDGIRVVIMVPGELVAAYTAVGERTLDAAAFYHELYGFFPHQRLGILPGPAGYWGGFPMPNVFMIHRGNLTEPFVRFIAAHELGHYYWGLHVLDAGERLSWLMLANGIFADQLYLARHHGRTLEEQWRTRGNGDWIEHYLTARVAGWEQRLGLAWAEDDALHFDYNSLIRHGKGATGVYLQARRIGVDRFVRLQRELLDEFRHRALDEDTFIRRLEEAGADGARTFFTQWARGDAAIDYVVDVVESVDGQAGAQRIVVQRFGTVGYPIELEVSDGNGVTVRRQVRPDVPRDTIVVGVRGPATVRLDPDGAVPLWNSSHPGMQRLFIHALENAGLTEPFLALSQAYLANHEDEEMARRRAARLKQLGRPPH